MSSINKTPEVRAKRAYKKHIHGASVETRRTILLTEIAREIREAVKAERERCARIAFDYPRKAFDPATDKLSPTWNVGELIRQQGKIDQ